MKQLDLHGYSYFDAEDKVENFILLNSKNLPVRIITGKSDKMKKTVKSVLERHKFRIWYCCLLAT